MDSIRITLPDGTVREFDRGVTGLQVAQAIGSRLASAALAVTVNGETRDVANRASLAPTIRRALDDYPAPSLDTARTPEYLSDEARRNLAALGYVGSTAVPVVRRDAPRPADMAHLFPVIEEASNLFVQEKYAQTVPLLQRGMETIKVDLRLIVATNKDLEEAISNKKYLREDLYYRLNVVTLILPPLRERKEDIAELASYFLKKFNRGLKKEIVGITPSAMEKITSYGWPGNIRQLENVPEKGHGPLPRRMDS